MPSGEAMKSGGHYLNISEENYNINNTLNEKLRNERHPECGFDRKL